MILLHRVYSDTHLFDEVEFIDGINIVLGKYSGEEEGREVNSIGKSTLVRLIDFALLSDTKKSFFSARKYRFLNEHNFTLEFSIDDVVYQVKRGFNNPNMVYYGKKGESLHEYTEAELRLILQNKFFKTDDYEGNLGNTWFRPLIKFFIKDDINHHERNDPLNFIHPNKKDLALLVYNFFLLGLPNQSIYNFDIINTEIKKLRETKTQLEKKVVEDTGKSIDEFKIEIFKIENRISKLETGLQKYKFLETYKDIENRLIELSNLISNELKHYHVLDRKLKDFQESHRLELETDIHRVRTLYKEINKALGDFIGRKLEEVITFRKEITENRKKFLLEREKKLEESINLILKKVSELEEERRKLYGILDEKNALDSIKNTYQQLIEEKAKLQKNMLSLDQIQEIEVKISELNTRLSETNTKVIHDLKQVENTIKNLIALFYEIISHAIFVDKDVEGAFFDIKAGANKKTPAKISIDVPKSESLGKSRFRILAYDLLVFLNIIRTGRRLPHFLIHDGVFHGIDKRTLVNVLNYINSQALINRNFQYIITANEDEIYIPEDRKTIYGNYNFDWETKVIKKYEDIPEKMIFKREF